MTQKRILMAMDTTDKQSHFVERASTIAKQLHADFNRLQLKPHVSPYGCDGVIASVKSLNEGRAKSVLKNFIAGSTESAAVTRDIAEQLNIDLIVTTEHKSEYFFINRNVDKFLLRQLLRDTLFIKNKVTDYRQVCCVVDLDQENINQIVSKAKMFADQFQADLHLLYSVEHYPCLGHELLTPEELEYEMREYLRAYHEKFNNIAEQFAIPSNQCVIKIGDLISTVKNYSEQNAIDLLMVGNQQHFGLGKMAPSTAAKLLHNVSCDLLALFLAKTLH